MDKKIVSLLNTNLRVIIPEFGAFIIRQQDPRIVVFKDYLRNDDGLLIDHIIKTDNMEPDVARQALAEYLNLINRTIESGGGYTIEGLGTLQRAPNGNLTFIQEEEDILPDSPEAGEKFVTGYQPAPDYKKAFGEELPGISTPPDKRGITSNSIFSRQLAKWILILLAVNLVIILFFAFRDNFQGQSKKNSPAGMLDEPVLNQLADSMMAAVKDSTTEPYRDPNAGKAPGNNLESLKYYIVAGCFREEINADELVDSLKRVGFKAEKFGKIGDLYAVSFASFDDKELAARELARIRKDRHPDAWIVHQ